LLGPWIRNLKEKRQNAFLDGRWPREPAQSPLSLYVFPFDFLSILFPKKRGGIDFAVSDRYGRFLSISSIRAPTTAIATTMTIDIGRKYCSAIVGGAVGCGVGVASASTMLKVVSSFDGQ
jgi:hypothetical protein